MVKLLLSPGANVNQTTTNGWTALHVAGYLKRPLPIFNCLIAHGTKVNLPNQRGDTALHIALAWSAGPDVIALLLAKGAHVNVRNNENQTPLQVARATGAHKDVIRLLEQKSKEQQPLHVVKRPEQNEGIQKKQGQGPYRKRHAKEKFTAGQDQAHANTPNTGDAEFSDGDHG